ncbi:MAG: EAL domain-containing protein [Parvularculaceae bacterium]|nr:EAL domain-containing protein [Parvularculaceae bacterium]
MVTELLVAAEAPIAAIGSGFSSLELGRGAIVGAMLISAAFLAGIAVLRSSAAALSGFVMVASAGVLLVFWLGLAGEPGPALSPLLQGVFAASVLIFLTATVPLAQNSRLLGGALFAGALSIVGIAVLNVALVGEATHLQRMGLYAAAIATFVITGIDAVRGDNGARLILPGALLAVAAPLVFGVGGGTGAFALVPQAIFAGGVLTASLVALLHPSSIRVLGSFPGDSAVQRFDGGDRHQGRRHSDNASRHAATVAENQLAQVLDYSGIAVWDWSRSANHQSLSFGEVMGADCDGLFTPDAIREFIHPDERARFEQRIFGPSEGDGGFDEAMRLVNGNTVRMRGARAVAKDGELERIVVFLERSECVAQHEAVKPDALKLAAVSLTGAAAALPAARCHEIASPHHRHDHDDGHHDDSRQDLRGRDHAHERKDLAPASGFTPEKSAVVRAVEEGSVVAAFQPIIAFETGKVCGAEALLRVMREGAVVEGEGAEDFARKAAVAGKGRAVALAMLKQAADHASARIKSGASGYFVTVNISASQLLSEGFAADVREVIAEHQLPKGALVIELTDAQRLAETPESAKALKAVRAAGAGLAYDDFGAGYSSLANLHRYEFDYLKIGRSFLDDIAKNGGKKKIAAALAKLGRDFEMTVIAEGIESDAAAKIARSIGCKMGQGFHFGQPSVSALSSVYGATAEPANDHDADHAEKPRRRGLFGGKAR